MHLTLPLSLPPHPQPSLHPVSDKAPKLTPPPSVAIGKRITPRVETRSMPGNYHYCFVDFSSVEEAQRALDALNGREIVGGNLRVSFPKSRGPAFESTGTNHRWGSSSSRDSTRQQQDGGRRQTTTAEGQEGQDGEQERRERNERQRTIMASNNWRSRG